MATLTGCVQSVVFGWRCPMPRARQCKTTHQGHTRCPVQASEKRLRCPPRDLIGRPAPDAQEAALDVANLRRLGEPNDQAEEIKRSTMLSPERWSLMAATSTAPVVTVQYAYDRWIRVVLLACESPSDFPNLGTWARAVGVSAPWLRAWCYAAGVRPKAALDFTRLLRYLVHCERTDYWSMLNAFDVVDQRTLRRMLVRGHVEMLFADDPPPVDVYLTEQQFVRDRRLIARLTAVRPKRSAQANVPDAPRIRRRT
jgi:hypothetical protein